MALTKITRGVIKANENYDTHNINSTGIVTAVSANFTGDVSIGGTLTYQDVTNIDSVGIITAQSDISIADKIVHTGDTNTALRFPAADTFTVETGGSERLRIDSSGKVGINSEGTTAYLTIRDSEDGGNGNNGSGVLRFSRRNGSSTNDAILYAVHDGSDGVSALRLNLGNSERVRILSTGTINIGDQGLSDEYIGSTVKIRKDQNSVTRLSLRNENSGSGSASAIQVGAHGNSWMLQCGSAANDSNAFTIRVDGTANSNTGTEKLRITTAGNVGIGLTNPIANLTVYGSTSAALFQNSNTGTTSGDGFFVGNWGGLTASIWQYENDAMNFGTNNTERLRITNAGKMGLGTNSPGSYDGEANDFVVAGSDHTGITIASTGSNQRTNLYFADGTSGNAAYRGAITYDHNGDYMMMRTSGTEGLRIDSDRNVIIGAKDFHSHNGTVDSLQIGYALNLYEDSYTSGTDNYAIWANNAYYAGSGGNKYMRNDEASRIYQHSGQIVFETAAAGTADNAITFNERLRITESGGYVQKSYGRALRYYTTTVNDSMYRTVVAISMGGNTAYEIRFTGTGNGITHAKCMASHWTSNYDLIRDSYIAMDSYSGLSIHDQFNKTSGTQGAWSFSRPGSGSTGYQSHLVINKSAGSYGGGMIGCIVLESDRPYELLSIT